MFNSADGLKYYDLVEGKGPVAEKGATVQVLFVISGFGFVFLVYFWFLVLTDRCTSIAYIAESQLYPVGNLNS